MVKKIKSVPKRKTSAKGNTPSSSRSKKSNKPKKNNAVSNQLIKQVCSITDPFCAVARGARWPDSSQTPSLPFQMHAMVPLTTDANGTRSLAFIPGWFFNYATNTSVSGSNYVFDIMSNMNSSTLMPNNVRLISAGLKLHCPTPSLTTQGLVYIRQFPITGVELLNIASRSFRGNYTREVALKDIKGDVVVTRDINETAHFYYHPEDITPNSTVSSFSNKGWNVVTITVDGALASTVVLNIEFIMNWEITFDDSSAEALLTNTPPPPNPLAIKTSHAVTADGSFSNFSSSKQLESFTWEKAARYVGAAAESFLPLAFETLALTLG